MRTSPVPVATVPLQLQGRAAGHVFPSRLLPISIIKSAANDQDQADGSNGQSQLQHGEQVGAQADNGVQLQHGEEQLDGGLGNGVQIQHGEEQLDGGLGSEAHGSPGSQTMEAHGSPDSQPTTILSSRLQATGVSVSAGGHSPESHVAATAAGIKHGGVAETVDALYPLYRRLVRDGNVPDEPVVDDDEVISVIMSDCGDYDQNGHGLVDSDSGSDLDYDPHDEFLFDIGAMHDAENDEFESYHAECERMVGLGAVQHGIGEGEHTVAGSLPASDSDTAVSQLQPDIAARRTLC